MTVGQSEMRAFTTEHLSVKKTNEILSPQILVSRHGPDMPPPALLTALWLRDDSAHHAGISLKETAGEFHPH